jgi:hypothetical protein
MNSKKLSFNPDQIYENALKFHHGGKLTEAEKLYKTLLDHFPNQHEILTALGILFFQQGHSESGFQCIKKSLNLNSNQPVALYNIGVELQKLNRLEEALIYYDKTIQLNPHDINALINRGNLLKDLKSYKKALISYEQALAINSKIPAARWNKAITHILLGEYEIGWKEYEWGWQSGERGEPRKFSQPTWLGNESIFGKTLFIYREQGLGDLIHFCRYIPLLEELGAKIILEAPLSLFDLMKSLSLSAIVVKEGESLPSFDLVCPIMSLALAFKTTIKNIPATIPYLRVEKTKKIFWEKKLGIKILPRIGIVWSGSLTNKIDNNLLTRRFIPLKQFQSIFNLPLEFHILQKEIRPEDQVILKSLNNVNDHQKELNDFSDTAAVIQEMDLVISICTSVAHLSGALGQHTWILLPYSADYRWMTQNNSPWYPTVELFRKTKPLEWDELILNVENKLKAKYLLK